jgi:hypothetical protein
MLGKIKTDYLTATNKNWDILARTPSYFCI